MSGLSYRAGEATAAGIELLVLNKLGEVVGKYVVKPDGRISKVAGEGKKANPNNVKVNQGQQDKHIPGTNNYKQEIANGKHKSILSSDPQQLLDEFAGTGQQISPTKERVNFGKVIGQYYDELTGQYIDTTIGIIHYDSRGGAHIVPARP